MHHHQSIKKELSVNPCCVWTWWVFPCWVEWSCKLVGCVSLSLSLSLSCVAVVVVVVVVCVCGVVWCGVLGWHAEKPPCVRSKRPRVYRQHVHTWKHMWTCCRYTRWRFERTHGERRGGGSSSVLLTKICPRGVITCPRGSTKKPMHVTYFQFENRSRTTRCRVLHLFASPEHTVQLQTHDTRHTQTCTHNTTTHSNTQQHSTEHATAQKHKRREEEMKETKRDRGERDTREEERGKERRERLKEKPERFESWSRTTPARILRSFALHKACHAQPLSRITVYICT